MQNILANVVQELSSNLSRIKVTAGDVRDIAAVSLVVNGANAVIECLSMASPGNRPGTVKRDGVAVIVEAMKHCGVKRLIVLSTGMVYCFIPPPLFTPLFPLGLSACYKAVWGVRLVILSTGEV